METSFTKLRSSNRVEFAKNLLKQRIIEDFTIDKVTEMACFYSRSTFFSTFKEFNGMTPTEFMEQTNRS